MFDVCCVLCARTSSFVVCLLFCAFYFIVCRLPTADRRLPSAEDIKKYAKIRYTATNSRNIPITENKKEKQPKFADINNWMRWSWWKAFRSLWSVRSVWTVMPASIPHIPLAERRMCCRGQQQKLNVSKSLSLSTMRAFQSVYKISLPPSMPHSSIIGCYNSDVRKSFIPIASIEWCIVLRLNL